MAKVTLDPNVGRTGDPIRIRGEVLTLDLDDIVKIMAKPLEDTVKKALQRPTRPPRPNTLLRRSSPVLWRVTGRLLGQIEARIRKGVLEILTPPGYFADGFVAGRMYQTTPLGKAIRKLQKQLGLSLRRSIKTRRK